MVSDKKMYDCIYYVNYLSNIAAKYCLITIQNYIYFAKQMNTQQHCRVTKHLDNTLTVISDRKRVVLLQTALRDITPFLDRYEYQKSCALQTRNFY